MIGMLMLGCAPGAPGQVKISIFEDRKIFMLKILIN